jgi:hypothetical protein
LELAPPIIRDIADINPPFYAVGAARSLFHGSLADAAILRGFIIVAIMALLAIVRAARNFLQAAA